MPVRPRTPRTPRDPTDGAGAGGRRRAAAGRVVGTYLERDGFEVRLAFDGPPRSSGPATLDPDVVVLDLGLPGIDGVEVCRRLRTFSDCYVVMLTARGDEVDKLVGLSVGADDYVTKPFSPRELVARVQAMLRRPRADRRTRRPRPRREPPLALRGPVDRPGGPGGQRRRARRSS